MFVPSGGIFISFLPQASGSWTCLIAGAEGKTAVPHIQAIFTLSSTLKTPQPLNFQGTSSRNSWFRSVPLVRQFRIYRTTTGTTHPDLLHGLVATKLHLPCSGMHPMSRSQGCKWEALDNGMFAFEKKWTRHASAVLLHVYASVHVCISVWFSYSFCYIMMSLHCLESIAILLHSMPCPRSVISLHKTCVIYI